MSRAYVTGVDAASRLLSRIRCRDEAKELQDLLEKNLDLIPAFRSMNLRRFDTPRNHFPTLTVLSCHECGDGFGSGHRLVRVIVMTHPNQFAVANAPPKMRHNKAVASNLGVAILSRRRRSTTLLPLRVLHSRGLRSTSLTSAFSSAGITKPCS